MTFWYFNVWYVGLLCTLALGLAGGRHGLAEEGVRTEARAAGDPPPPIVQESGLAGGTQPQGFLGKGCSSCLRASGEIPYRGGKFNGGKFRVCWRPMKGEAKQGVLRC